MTVLQEKSRPLTAGALKLLDDAIAAGGASKFSRAELVKTLEGMPVEERALWLTRVAMAKPIKITF